MPQQKNITVKNGASPSVDKVFIALTPSAGDKARALWRLPEGPVVAVQPTFQSSSDWNKARDARTLDFIIKVPSHTVATDGSIRQHGSMFGALNVVIPNSYLEADKPTAAKFIQNLLSSDDVYQMILQGMSAT